MTCISKIIAVGAASMLVAFASAPAQAKLPACEQQARDYCVKYYQANGFDAYVECFDQITANYCDSSGPDDQVNIVAICNGTTGPSGVCRNTTTP